MQGLSKRQNVWADVTAARLSLAADNIDGVSCCDPNVGQLVDGAALLAPGRHALTWSSEDRMGNSATATQYVSVRPLVSVNKDRTSAEGSQVRLRVILNGASPHYPLTVPYVIDAASTATNADHNLVNGSVIFSSGQTEAVVNIDLIEDGVAEADEQLIVRLDDRTSRAQDLANGYNADNPNIFDLNSGTKTRHVITISERNIAPEVGLQLRQDGMNTIQVVPDGGAVTALVTVNDPNSGDSHSFNWSESDTALAETDGNTGNASLVFNPSRLSAGRYRLRVEVTDSAGASSVATLYFRVVAALPQLSASADTDNDGFDDAFEGTADSDDDGIADYLDNISALNVLPEAAAITNAYLLECDPGVRCRLGQFALLSNGGGARLDAADLEQQPDLQADTEFEPVGGIFDFEMHELPEVGQSVRVVVPQAAAIPDSAVYRKFFDNAWHSFTENAANELHSAPGRPGFCPPPGDLSWQAGLVPGFHCLQLTIEDGGPNDGDGVANRSVEDPGAVSVAAAPEPPVKRRLRSRKSGGADGWLWLLMGGLVALGRRSKIKAATKTLALPIAVGLAAALPQPSQAQQPAVGQRYVDLSLLRADTDQSAAEFSAGLNAAGATVTVFGFDTQRSGYELNLGYRLHRWATLQVGYLSLGDTEVDFELEVAAGDAWRAALERHYPATGKGLTFSYRYDHALSERLDVFASAGLFAWRSDIELRSPGLPAIDTSGRDPLLGLGGHYHLDDHWSLGAKFQRVFFDGQAADSWGITLRYIFK